MTTIYWAGGEDTDLFTFTGGVTTTAGNFRSAYARCALDAGNNGFWESHPYFTATTFWCSGWNIQNVPGGTLTNNGVFMGWRSSDGVFRLGVVGGNSSSTFKVVKINAAGTVTQLGSNFTMNSPGLQLNKIDVFVDYQVAGTITVYQQSVNSGAVQVFTYSGDVTTDGITSLASALYGSPNQSGVFGTFKWSEGIVSDTDTRSDNLQTCQPVANGNTHNFDTGSPAAANVNETTLSDAALDGSTTAGQIDQYTIPSIASGTYTIKAFGVGARMQKGVTGPSKMDLGVRTGGADFWSSDQVLTTSWGQYQNWWNTDPNTGVTWAALPTNIGLKAVT
jgi:hypothetical protein